MTEKDIEEAKDALAEKRRKLQVSPKDLLSTGSTLLNLACTGRTTGGFIMGGYYLIVGDSRSGKSFLALTCLAEAACNKRFDGYRLVFDDAENGAQMDFEAFFGKKAAERIEPPGIEDGIPVYSETVEDFWDTLEETLDKGPTIWVLDSMDTLLTSEEISLIDKRKAARKKGKDEPGSYGTSKAKINKSRLRAIIPKLKRTKSILVIISQTIDRIGFGAQFDPKTRAGGHSLRFFATAEIWTSIKGTLSRSVLGKERKVGIIAKAEVKKNRGTGRIRSVLVPIDTSYGIDDLQSCIDFLVEEGHFKSKGAGKYLIKEWNETLSVEEIVDKVDKEDLFKEVQLMTADRWNLIESKLALKRKPRYD